MRKIIQISNINYAADGQEYFIVLCNDGVIYKCWLYPGNNHVFEEIISKVPQDGYDECNDLVGKSIPKYIYELWEENKKRKR